MAITTDNIRDLLNRPRGLNNATIEEYITIRTAEVNKKARSTEYLAADSANAISTEQKEAAIKSLVCADCLLVLVNTVPSFYPSEEQKAIDQRFQFQLKEFRQRADDLLDLISGKGGTAFVTTSTDTRQPTATNETDVIRNSLRETSPYE